MNIDNFIYMPPLPSYSQRNSRYRVYPVPHLWYGVGDSKDTLVFYHGNAVDAAECSAIAQGWNQSGYNVMVVEYPGYGAYGGEVNSDLVKTDVQKLAGYLREKCTRVRIVGQSIGTGPAAELACHLESSGLASSRDETLLLVLITPFTTLSRLAGEHFWPAKFFVSDTFSPLRCCRKLARSKGSKDSKIQVYVHHGTADNIINYAHAKELCRFHGVKLRTYTCGHNNIFDFAWHAILADLSAEN